MHARTHMQAGLKLEWVFGYAGFENTCNNLFVTAMGKLVYYVAAVGVVYDPDTHTQKFYQAHDDDIKCMAIHPDRLLVATGQVASALDGSADVPYLTVWDSRDTSAFLVRINFPSDGESNRCVWGGRGVGGRAGRGVGVRKGIAGG